MEEHNYSVYIHTSPNNKRYIGISKHPKDRWDYGHGYKQNTYFWNAIKKYGWNNFKHEIVFVGLTENEAKHKEIMLIKKYKSNNRQYGYNHTIGGDNLCEQRKQKVYQFDLLGNLLNSYDSIRGAERKTKVNRKSIWMCCSGKMNTGGRFLWSYCKNIKINDNDRFGKIVQISMTDLSIVKIFNNREEIINNTKYNIFDIYKVCESKKENYKKFYWCYFKDINDINKHFHPKGIMKIDPNTNKIIKLYPDMIEAAIDNGVSNESIRCALCGIQNKSAGFKWKYIA